MFIVATRPIEVEEYNEVMRLLLEGFEYEDGDRIRSFRPNRRVAMALMLQASLGLRIGDILDLKLNQFRNGKLQITESKTKKLQYRDINQEVLNEIYNYAIDNGIKQDDKLFTIGVRAIQKQLKLVIDYLGYENISTHSFRKLYATLIYENNNNDIYLVKELLNHSNIQTTQEYIRVKQEEINKASASINLMRN